MLPLPCSVPSISCMDNLGRLSIVVLSFYCFLYGGKNILFLDYTVLVLHKLYNASDHDAYDPSRVFWYISIPLTTLYKSSLRLVGSVFLCCVFHYNVVSYTLTPLLPYNRGYLDFYPTLLVYIPLAVLDVTF